jgi:hypothetical protein
MARGSTFWRLYRPTVCMNVSRRTRGNNKDLSLIELQVRLAAVFAHIDNLTAFCETKTECQCQWFSLAERRRIEALAPYYYRPVP